MNLKDLILKANRDFEVIWHFNVSDFAMIKAIFQAAYEVKKPVIIGVSEGERKFFGTYQIKNIIDGFRKEYNFPIFLNADHCHSFESAKEAIDIGFDSIIFDGSKLDLAQNILETKKVVEYAKNKNPDILVEGELGFIGDHSSVLYDLPAGVILDSKYFTKPEEALEFINKTGVDLFSPFVGNIHGIILNNNQILNSSIDINLIKEIKKITNHPLVLHGGSGINNDYFVQAVKSGINIIHISTELRIAWLNGLKKFLQNNNSEITPYKILSYSYDEVYKIAQKYFNLI